MIDRIEQLRAAGLDAIERASDTDALEEVRIAYLGRRADLPNLLRGVAEFLPPIAVPSARRRTKPARRSRRRLSASRNNSRRPSSTDASRVIASTSPCRPIRSRRSAACTSLRRRAGRSRTCSCHSGSPSPRTRGRTRLLQLRCAQPRPDAPGAGVDGHLLCLG